MAKAKIMLKIPSEGAAVRRLNGEYENVLPQLADTILSDCNEYVPVQTGALRNSGHIENGGKRIIWNVKYAKKRYYTGRPKQNVNPKASLRWCEVAIRAHESEWAARASKLLKG